MVSEPRSREARDRAEDALVRFALLTGEHAHEFVVIGGLNPDFLAPEAPVPHQGTTDVDILLELAVIYERDDNDFGWLDEALTRGEFVDRKDGWRWYSAGVLVDLLCDVGDSRGQAIALPGATLTAAQNLDGPAAALRDPIVRKLRVSAAVKADFPHAPNSVDLRFASVGGYIAAKAAALLARGLEKDAYDLMFVVMYAPGGPAAVAEDTIRAKADHQVVAAAIKRFVDEGEWTRRAVMMLVTAGDEEEEQQLSNDVTVAARRFLDRYEV